MHTYLIISQVFPPDPTSLGQHLLDAAQEIQSRGNRVRVLTANRGYEDLNEKFKFYEEMEGVAVHRLPFSSFGKANVILRLFGQISFLVQCIVRGVFSRGVSDVLVSTSPPMAAIVAVIIAWLRPKTRIHYWVMDLNPDQSVRMGVFNANHVLVVALDWLNRGVLLRSQSIVAMDIYMAELLRKKVSNPELLPIFAIPPWPMDDHLELVEHLDNPFRNKYELNAPSESRVIMYSGNHSIVHSLHTLLEGMDAVKQDCALEFFFVGGGAGKRQVEDFVEGRSDLSAVLLPYQPLDSIKYSLSAADVHVVAMGENMVGVVHPCKVYGAMALGRPIIYIGPKKSHVGDLMELADIGWQVEHGEVGVLTEVLREIANCSKEMLKRKGDNARMLVRERLSKEKLCSEFVQVVTSRD